MKGSLPQVDYLLVDLISSCNLSCLHCRAAAGSKNEVELTFETFQEILKDAKSLKVRTITLSGGEPLLKKDIFEFIKLAKEKGFIVRMQSNILLLNEEKIKKLRQLKIDYVGTGIDGLETNHDKLRNKKGAFKKVIKNISLLKKYGIKTHVEFTATTFNFRDFEEVLKLCKKLGVYDIMTRAVIPAGRGEEFKFSLSKKQYQKFLKKVVSLQNGKINIKLYCQDPVSISLNEKRAKKIEKKYAGLNIIGGCSAGINMLYISPLGEVNPCSFLKISFGNIHKKRLKEIVTSIERKKFLEKQLTRNFKKCADCDLKKICGGCRARALKVYGELWGEDPFCYK